MGSRGSAKLRGRLEGGPPSRTRPRVQARDDVVRDPDPGATHAVRHRVRVDVVVELRARVRVDMSCASSTGSVGVGLCRIVTMSWRGGIP
jgi:hypothetical protein